MSSDSNSKRGRGWRWVPTLYFAEGLPYVIVMNVAIVMFTKLGISLGETALYTSYLYLPWVIKPLWSPIVDMLKSKRWWIIAMQILIGGALAGIAVVLPAPHFFRYSLALLWIMAFASATHDISADGFYMLALDESKQAYFVGIRNTFYRIATIAGQGGIVILAGILERHFATENLPEECSPPGAWSVAIGVAALLYIAIAIYHKKFLPHPERSGVKELSQVSEKNEPLNDPSPKQSFLSIFADFFRKGGIIYALLLILLFRFAEAQLVKVASPFLLATRESGGLGLSTAETGFIYGTLGVISLLVGGILGGLAISRRGLKFWLIPMTFAMNLPNLLYLWLAWALPTSHIAIATSICLEELGYGFTALTCFMLYFSRGKNATAHYSICTGFMALGMMLPGLFSGYIAENLGYLGFFQWIIISTIPAFIIAYIISRRYDRVICSIPEK